LKHFTIAYTDEDDNFCEICEYAEKSDEAIRNAINDVPLLKNNNYIFRCTNESDLEWISTMEYFRKKELDKDSISKEGKYNLKAIKEHLAHILYWFKTSLKNSIDQ
tara:strand:+ start:869 stop:1186 length:318 start_codon:yes stop_codon:yes gene_type:complete